ncbi:MAG: 4Fe-4S binding protein [Candidatus Thiosymbion ectosymbiont of Robbea hypermnestra]|nr:4Fe-4S binding protein [Candidatus Thiosymbion ectosymbiont of Robbea hypermnestra]
MEREAPTRLSYPMPDGSARAAALTAVEAVECRPAPVVAYESGGSVAIIGPESAVLRAADSLGDNLDCTLVITEPTGPDRPAEGKPKGREPIHASVDHIRGYLGRFEVLLAGPDGPVGLGAVTAGGRPWVDLVLDLTTPGLISCALPPVGYYAPAGDPAALAQALAEIPGLVGRFEKPKFFDYNPALCAHGRSGIRACTRCIDTCPAGAIDSLGERVEIDSNLCQGAGSCATACPTGAITYAYPRLADTLERLRAALGAYREAGGNRPVILFHDAAAGQETLTRLAPRLPEAAIPLRLEEIGSVGMDVWLAAIAYGAARVLLLVPPTAPSSVVAELETQLLVAGELLAGMGYPRGTLRLSRETRDDRIISELAAPEAGCLPPRPAGFAGLNEKRTVIRLAVDHLFREAPAPRPLVSLPTGAPFGDILLDEARCTLCMACVSQCPGRALSAGDERPELGFVEENCIQCALCARSCPENAIAPTPRYLYDREARRRRRLLKSEEPLRCARCGAAFATRGMIERMTTRLAGHALFRGAARSRLALCAECRVKAILEAEQEQAAGDGQTPGERT